MELLDYDSRKEVENDFCKALGKIDFSEYNPGSTEFIYALRIGLMWSLLCKLEHHDKENHMDKKMFPDEISDKIMSAKKYLQKYMDSGDMSFKEMSNDDIRHAEILIKKANSRLPSGDEKSKLKDYEKEIVEIKNFL